MNTHQQQTDHPEDQAAVILVTDKCMLTSCGQGILIDYSYKCTIYRYVL